MEYDTYLCLARSRAWLAEHFDQPVRLRSAAEIAFYSEFHFHRRFAEQFGETPHQFVTRLRMERAQELLRSRELSVSDVCLAVGYESLGSFSAAFSKRFGQPPTEFRRVFSAPGIWALKVTPACFLRKIGEDILRSKSLS